MFASPNCLLNCGQQDDSAYFVAILLAILKVMKSISGRIYMKQQIYIFFMIYQKNKMPRNNSILIINDLYVLLIKTFP